MSINIKTSIAILLVLSCSCFSQPGTAWQQTGPNLFPTNESGQVNGIGRVCQLKFHPTNPLKMYAVTASGGLWISNDSALTWVKTGTDKLPSTACASACIDYTNDNIIYLGTGDPNYYSPDFGIWKSIDGGQNWLQSSIGMGNRLPVEILMDPTNTNVLVTATDNGIYKSTNAGANWSLVKTGGDFTDMQFKPGSSSTLYACTFSEFWRSTDFGSTWTQITNGVVIPGGGSGNGMRIAVSAANPNVVYLGMIADEGTILKSVDGGTSFITIYNNPAQSLVGYDAAGGGQGDYNFGMTADPLNENTVFVVAHVVWRSDDGGITWTQLTDWWDQLHTDMHAIKFHPNFPNKLFNINDGGVWLSNDAGDNWVPKSDELGATEIYHASQSPIKRDMISIGTQDNGELYFNSNTWRTNRGGDWTSKSSFDYLTNNVVYYYETGDRRPVNSSETSYNLPFVATNNSVLEFTKKNNTLAFSGEQNVWITTNLNNSSPTWSQISTFNQTIKAINSSQADSSVLYVITANSKIYRSDNVLSAAPTFTNFTTPASTNLFANIATVKTNSNVVYISCGSRVYRSTNRGAAWTNVSSNLPLVNILKIYHDEFSPNETIYICSANAVYYKDATMTNWINISYNLPSIASIRDFMLYNPGTAASLLRVAYYGRGVWELPINTSFAPAPDFAANTNTICVNQSVAFTDLSIGNPTTWNWTFAGGSPSTSTLPNPTISYSATGIYNVTLTISNSNGSNSITKTSFINVTIPQAIPFSEGFTASATPSNWENYDQGNDGVIWEHSLLAGGFGTSSQSVYFDNFNNDVNRKRDELRTPKFDFSFSSHPLLLFDRAYARYDNTYTDTLAVLVSNDCGYSYTQVYIKGNTNLATAPDKSSSIFIPTATQWKRDTIDLSAYAGDPNVMVSFQNRGFYGQAIYLDNINISNSVITSVNNLINDAKITVYPNPSSGNITLNLFSAIKENYHLEIFNAIGKKIYSEQLIDFNGSLKKEINLSAFGSGLYILNFTNNSKTNSIKVIIE
ncbi:MAG: PKD domain-containing protein [Bacteroidia bacterium]|nr:PKD domain-containing protein [Bacteroidia bacterium]